MSCGEIKALLSPYIDNELSLSECAKVNEHLSHCKTCSAELQSLQNLRKLMNQSNLRYEIPSDLERRVFKTIAKEERVRISIPAILSVRQNFGQNLGWIAAIFIAVISVTQLHHTKTNPEDELAQEVVSEHLRAVKTDHLIEVVSTDQHTVKPWFNGKVDFAPMVKDLKENDFPLIGGRVDYLSGHPVATVVFQRRKHVIDLFIWPDQSAQEASVQSFSINGYNIFKWSKDGFWYWAISDLNPTELTEFMQIYKK